MNDFARERILCTTSKSFIGGEFFRGENLVSLLGAVRCVSGIVRRRG